jgi:hypothetical protein
VAITASVVRGFTFATGVAVDAASLNELGEPGVTVATPIAVGNGGTNATTASAARTNLGLGTIATQASNAVALTGGTISGTIMTLPSYAVSGVPSASPAGQVIYVTDGNSGAATVACSDGSDWKVVALGAAIST